MFTSTFTTNVFITYLTITIHHLLYSNSSSFKLWLNKMNFETNLIEDYVNFVDSTKKTK